MENLLPILLGLAFLGFKYYTKTQKEKAKQARQSMPSQEPVAEFSPSLNDFINTFYEEAIEEKKPAIAEEIIATNSSTETWKEQMHMEEPSSIEFTDERATKKQNDMQFEMIQNKPNQSMERLDFDLRKAIVYDAIMNPPYI